MLESIIRILIKGMVVLIMFVSLPAKVFNTFFDWRGQKQSNAVKSNKKNVKIELF